MIISYFYPPCAKSGVHRVLKLAKCLPDHDIEPYVLTVADGKCDRIDEGLAKDLDHVPVWRTHQFYPLRNKKGLIARGWRKTWKYLSVIDEHIGWIPFAYVRGLKIIRKHRLEGIFVTGYPFSSFLIGVYLKKKTRLPLFLDYRDPWTSNPAFTNRLTKRFAAWAERVSLKACNLYFGATPAIMDSISERYASEIKKKGRTFTFSFDGEGPAFTKPGCLNAQKKMHLISAGSLYDSQVGSQFVSALKHLRHIQAISPDNFALESYGNLKLSGEIEADLGGILKVSSFIPHHELMERMANCDGLVLLHGSGPVVKLCYPGRMFEYFAAGKPILYIGPAGIAADTIRKSGMGICAEGHDQIDIERKLVLYLKKLREGNLEPNIDFINTFKTEHVLRRFVNDIGPFINLASS